MSTIALLHMDGVAGATAFPDLAGNAWTAVGTASVSNTAPEFGNGCLLLDGSSGYITTPDAPQFDWGNGAFTIECWIKPFASSANYGIASKAQGTGASLRQWEFYLSGGTLFFAAFDAANNAILTMSGGVPAPGSWSHVAASYDGTTWRLFLNGNLQASSGAVGTMASVAVPVAIGSQNSDSAVALFHGSIDEFRISNTAVYTANFTPSGPFTIPGVIVLGDILAFDSDPAFPLPYRWKSKQFFVPYPTTYRLARVTADSYVNTVLQLYADGVLYATIPVASQEEFTLPAQQCLKYFEFAVSGTDKVDRVQFVEDAEEFT